SPRRYCVRNEGTEGWNEVRRRDSDCGRWRGAAAVVFFIKNSSSIETGLMSQTGRAASIALWPTPSGRKEFGSVVGCPVIGTKDEGLEAAGCIVSGKA